MLKPFKFVQRDKQGTSRNTLMLDAKSACPPTPLEEDKCRQSLHVEDLPRRVYTHRQDTPLSVGGPSHDK